MGSLVVLPVGCDSDSALPVSPQMKADSGAANCPDGAPRRADAGTEQLRRGPVARRMFFFAVASCFEPERSSNDSAFGRRL